MCVNFYNASCYCTGSNLKNNNKIQQNSNVSFGANYWENTCDDNFTSIFDMSFFNNNFYFAKDNSDIKLKNEKIKEKYNINSEINNPILLDKVNDALQHFCELNCTNDEETKEMFKGLSIDDNTFIQNNELHQLEINQDTKEFKLHFNADTDWKNIEFITKDNYNRAKIPTNNSNYYIYKGLADYLNQKNNHNKHGISIMSNRSMLKTLRFSNNCIDYEAIKDFPRYQAIRLENPNYVNEYCSSYIAVKMCGEYLQGEYTKIYKALGGDMNLKFPQANCPIEKAEDIEMKFKSAKKAEKFLLNKYGINVDFKNNLEYANACVSAVKDLVKITNNKQIFNGLQIYFAENAFPDNSPMRCAVNSNNFNTVIQLSPNVTTDEKEQQKYDRGNISARTVKGCFMHELVHYIDCKSNTPKYIFMNNKIQQNEMGFNNEGVQMASYISSYAAEDILEFVAEYITGKASGSNYPKETDNLFNFFWNDGKHPKLNFAK